MYINVDSMKWSLTQLHCKSNPLSCIHKVLLDLVPFQLYAAALVRMEFGMGTYTTFLYAKMVQSHCCLSEDRFNRGSPITWSQFKPTYLMGTYKCMHVCTFYTKMVWVCDMLVRTGGM